MGTEEKKNDEEVKPDAETPVVKTDPTGTEELLAALFSADLKAHEPLKPGNIRGMVTSMLAEGEQTAVLIFIRGNMVALKDVVMEDKEGTEYRMLSKNAKSSD